MTIPDDYMPYDNINVIFKHQDKKNTSVDNNNPPFNLISIFKTDDNKTPDDLTIMTMYHDQT
jgi:hypothetical protein